MWRTRVSSFEQQRHSGEEKLKVRESELLSQLSPADERVQTPSASDEKSLQRKSALEPEVACFLDQLFAAVLASTVVVESKLALAHEKLTSANDKFGKSRAEVKMGRDQIDFNRQRA